MASWELARLGYKITIYEKEKILGGNLSVMIPEYRLPLDVVMDDISWLNESSINVITDVCIGKDISLGKLQKKHDAVLLAAGACKPVKTEIPGENAQNVYLARSFLKSVKQGKLDQIGKSILIVGGGNTAIDSALTAKRLGAEEVRIACLERTDEMTAFPHAISEAIEEGIVIDPGWGPSSFLLENDLAVALRFYRCVQLKENECFAPLLDEETEHVLKSDAFIIAVGDRPDYESFDELANMASNESEFTSDPLTGETKISGLFAAGDFVSGSTSVVEAMGSGRKASISIDRYLQGEDLHYGRQYPGPVLQEFDIDLSTTNSAPRQEMAKISLSDRRNFKEINLSFNEEQALAESKRCLSCGVPVGYQDACWFCLPCEISCPEEALTLDIPYTIR
jgi:NADPH-dependent glutamate synthase beta subunit-like oxidoreductase